METPSKVPHSGSSPWKRFLITASILSCWIQSTSAKNGNVVKPTISLKGTKIMESDSLVLTCSTENKGVNITWYFNGQLLSLNERMDVSENDQTLTIRIMKKEDTGSYQCDACNPISAKSSDHLNLTVNYGLTHIKILLIPENEEIEIKFNNPLILVCQTLSYLSSQDEWYVNDNMKSKPSRNTFIITSVSWEDSGKYICLARINITNFSMFKDIINNVNGKVTCSSVCMGYIIGTVIGILVGVVLTGVFIYILYFRKTGRANKHHHSEKNSAPKQGEDTSQRDNTSCLKGSALPTQDLGSSSTSPESNYQTLDITKVDIYDKITSKKNPQA